MSSPSLDQIDKQLQWFSYFRITQPIICSFFVLLFPFEFAGFVEFLLDDKKKRSEKHIFYLRLSLFLSCIFISASGAASMIMAYGTGFDYDGCNALVRVSGGVYVVAVLSGLSFLLQKAKLVGKFEVENKTYQFIFKSVNLGLIGMVPLGFGMAVGLSEPKLLLDGRCVMTVPVWYPWFFCINTAGLSSALVWLFIHPIRNSLKVTGSEAKDDMKRVYYKNTIISTVAVLITFLIFVVFAICHQLVVSNEDDSWLIMALTVLNFDLLVMSAAGRLTTSIWLPSYIRQRLCHVESTSSPATGSKHIPNSPAQSSRDGKQLVPAAGSQAIGQLRPASSANSSSLPASSPKQPQPHQSNDETSQV